MVKHHQSSSSHSAVYKILLHLWREKDTNKLLDATWAPVLTKQFSFNRIWHINASTQQSFPVSHFQCSRMLFTALQAVEGMRSYLLHCLYLPPFLTSQTSLSSWYLFLVASSSPHSKIKHVSISVELCVALLYLLLQGMLLLFQADFFGPHQLQSFFGDRVLQPLDALHCRCPRGFAKPLLVGAHPLVQSWNTRWMMTLSIWVAYFSSLRSVTFLSTRGGFKELNGEVLNGQDGSVRLLLPFFILFPQALHTTRTQPLRLQGDLTQVKHRVFTLARTA